VVAAEDAVEGGTVVEADDPVSEGDAGTDPEQPESPAAMIQKIPLKNVSKEYKHRFFIYCSSIN